jgi:hypothetical protein
VELDLRNIGLFCVSNDDGVYVSRSDFDLLTLELAWEMNLRYEAEKDTARCLDRLTSAERERDMWKEKCQKAEEENKTLRQRIAELEIQLYGMRDA